MQTQAAHYFTRRLHCTFRAFFAGFIINGKKINFLCCIHVIIIFDYLVKLSESKKMDEFEILFNDAHDHELGLKKLFCQSKVLIKARGHL